MAGIMISKRTEEMTSFIVMDVLERANEMERQGIDVVHLEVGEPDFDTPDCVKTAACQALTDGYTHYTHSLGMLELREAISCYYHDTYGVNVEPDQIVVTSGSSPAIFMTFALVAQAADDLDAKAFLALQLWSNRSAGLKIQSHFADFI